ncbi:ATP-grasp domain-containing protein [Qipengyuania nanhaisediminis]|uniref:ATP-grasp domain-containing protein n=1 Tax=Qipengyuania nanhaisediminis TaxID=604088 RepID=UPI0038B3DA0C
MISGPILLTGAAGDIGVALAEVLRESFASVPILGADCNASPGGARHVDRMHHLPRADDPAYLAALERIVADEGVRLIIPLAEAELARLLSHGLIGASIGGAPVLTANARAVATGLDKLATARALASSGIAVPECGIVGRDEPGDYDLVIKPRSGQGSKGLTLLSRSDYDGLVDQRRGALWQRRLSADDQEYTCGLARFAQMEPRSLSFRRRLRGGLTGSGEVVHDPRITKLCDQVADALALDGAINVQLRLDDGVPMIFEINPRFSSTVGFRHKLGFRDAIWAISDRLDLPVEDYDPPPAGTRIERVADERAGLAKSV